MESHHRHQQSRRLKELSVQLETLDYGIPINSDGVSARETASADPPHFNLLDILTPRMAG
jgi:hypothetical protein